MTQTIGDIDALRKVPLHYFFGRADTHRKASVRCPFHNDKNPSMVIFPDGGFICHSARCAVHGNSIDFCLKMGLTFTETVEELTKLK